MRLCPQILRLLLLGEDGYLSSRSALLCLVFLNSLLTMASTARPWDQHVTFHRHLSMIFEGIFHSSHFLSPRALCIDLASSLFHSSTGVLSARRTNQHSAQCHFCLFYEVRSALSLCHDPLPWQFPSQGQHENLPLFLAGPWYRDSS